MTRRSDFLETVSRVVVKVGSQVIAPSGSLADRTLDDLCRGVLSLRENGLEVVLVSSGAVAAGARALGLEERPKSIPLKQASAAAGQLVILDSYARRLSSAGVQVAQVLLTADDVRHRDRFINARNTFRALLEVGALPVVNENDTVAVDEIKLGDNDRLSAFVANLVEAELLVLLTDVDGFYDGEPGAPGSRLYGYVEEITSTHLGQAGPSGSDIGLGGMITKLDAARQASRAGTATVVARGSREGVLQSILGGEEIGTWFAASAGMSARKHWIAYSTEPQGSLTIDAGAVEAIGQRGKSLLPSGILDVDGLFERGESVRVLDETGVEVCRGLAGYSAGDLRQIRGRQSHEIEGLLGYRHFDEAIHRDNLVLS